MACAGPRQVSEIGAKSLQTGGLLTDLWFAPQGRIEDSALNTFGNDVYSQVHLQEALNLELVSLFPPPGEPPAAAARSRCKCTRR